MNITKEEYLNMEEDKLPYTTKWGYIITKAEGYCCNCNEKLVGMKTRIIPYDKFVIVHAYGICHNCKLVVICKPYKIEEDRQCIFEKDDNMWKEINILPWYIKLLNIILYPFNMKIR